MLAELTASEKVVGAKQTKRVLNDDRAKLVFLAKDADPRVTAQIEALCAEKAVQTNDAFTMHEIGAACGISVGCAVAALLRT